MLTLTHLLPFAVWIGPGGNVVEGDTGVYDCDDCPCGAPCTSCDPGGSGSSPKSVSVTNAANCTDVVTPVTYSTFTSSASRCKWTWSAISGQKLTRVELTYVLQDATTVPGDLCTDLTGDAGEWFIYLVMGDSVTFVDYAWFEQTTGFACDAGTGRVSGTHAYSAGACHTGGTSCDNDTPTLTVAA